MTGRPRLAWNLLVGGVLLLAVVGLAVAALAWTPYDPVAVNLRQRLRAPSALHWLGTDEFGRDVLSRLMAAAGTSMAVSLATVAAALLVGVPLGVLGGYVRGWADRALTGLNDALLAFPGILLALGLLSVIGPSRWGVVAALGLAYAPVVARVARSGALSIREREYVEASRALGNPEAYTVLRHVLPNLASPLLVLATSLFGWVILAESALSFLGLGVPPPAPSWGNMSAGARPYLESAWWLAVAPGAAIAISLLGANLLGDGLRDLLDPRARPVQA